MNREAIEQHMKYLQDDHYDREFYVALLLYDVKGLTSQDLTDEIIDKAYERAETILKEHIDKLHVVAGILLEKVKIDGEEFAKVFEN